MGEHDEGHGGRGPPKGAALAASPLPAPLLSLLAEEELKGHKQRKLNRNEGPIHSALLMRDRSLPQQALSDEARARRGAWRGWRRVQNHVLLVLAKERGTLHVRAREDITLHKCFS